MARGRSTITPFIVDDIQDHCNEQNATSPTSSFFPYLKRLDAAHSGNMPVAHSRPHKKALLTLRLTSASFLDSVVLNNNLQKPLYRIETAHSRTTLLRYDAQDEANNAAEIKWTTGVYKGRSKDLHDGAFIQMAGDRWKSAESFLKVGGIVSARKFQIPNYPHSLKWKRSGSSFHCTTSQVKGPIAVFEPAFRSVTPRLIIYETFHDEHEIAPRREHCGVAVMLIDYLLVTALLLGTEAGEHANVAARTSTVPPTIETVPATPATPATMADRQWRKIIYGEPLFPSIRSSSPALTEDNSAWDGASQTSSAQYPQTPLTPTSGVNSYAESSYSSNRIPPVPPLPTLDSQYESRLAGAPNRSLSLPGSTASLVHHHPRLTPPLEAEHDSDALPEPDMPWLARSRSSPSVNHRPPFSPIHPYAARASPSPSPERRTDLLQETSSASYLSLSVDDLSATEEALQSFRRGTTTQVPSEGSFNPSCSYQSLTSAGPSTSPVNTSNFLNSDPTSPSSSYRGPYASSSRVDSPSPSFASYPHADLSHHSGYREPTSARLPPAPPSRHTSRRPSTANPSPSYYGPTRSEAGSSMRAVPLSRSGSAASTGRRMLPQPPLPNPPPLPTPSIKEKRFSGMSFPRTLPSPPNGSTAGTSSRPPTKEDLADWMHGITSRTSMEAGAATPAMSFDVPPPAYHAIDFSTSRPPPPPPPRVSAASASSDSLPMSPSYSRPMPIPPLPVQPSPTLQR
ncbi:hypothetical protein PLICRDRAFT_172675 [Plicaturopsis crispa FD-325 SS-3]|nr:hypothetical protein PLICRDRAFT_172675 [Plicaturopsis crispa FD-325 SS-3]